MAPIAWLRVDMNFLWLYLVLLSFTSFHRAVALRLPSASSRELYRVFFFLPSLRKKRSSTVNGFLRGWLRLSRNTRRRNKEERATRAAVDDAWHSASASLSPPLFLNRVLLFSCFVLQASSEPDFTSFIKVSLDFTRWSLQLTLNELLPNFIHQGNFFGRISHSGFQNPNLTNQWGSKIELPSFFFLPPGILPGFHELPDRTISGSRQKKKGVRMYGQGSSSPSSFSFIFMLDFAPISVGRCRHW